MDKERICVLDDSKICDDCGECDRCDLDPNKICDNCCRCIAMEDEGNEFRSFTVDANGIVGGRFARPTRRSEIKKPIKESEKEDATSDPEEEPYELTPELLEYWEKKLIECGEAPADDGFGKIAVNTRNPYCGKRTKPNSRKRKTDQDRPI